MSASPRPSPQTPPTGADRRVYARHAVVQDQIVAIAFEGDNGGLILDVSQHGCSVQTVGPLESGVTTEFDFVLPSTGKRLRGRAQVRWAERSGRAGLRFLEFSRGSLADLTAWLARPSVPPPVLPAVTPAPAAFEETEIEINITGLSVNDALAHIAARTRDLTRASGVAIATGTVNEMICRASVGAAPSLGAKLQANSGLSGECVRSRVLVRCDDTESDSRVDAALCRQLDLRSAVLIPVLREDEIVAVLEVFSNVPRAFGSFDIQRLCRTAELVRSVLDAPKKTGDAPIAAAVQTEPVVPASRAAQTVVVDLEPPATPKAEAKPVAAELPTLPQIEERIAAAPPAAPVIAPTVVKTPAPQPRVFAATAPAPAVRSKKLTRAERSALLAAHQKPAAEFAAYQSSSALPTAAKVGFAAACALMLIAGAVFLRPRSAPKAAVQPVSVAAPAASTPAPLTSATAADEAKVPATTPKAQPKAPASKETKSSLTEALSAETVAPEEIRRPSQQEEEAPAPFVIAPSLMPSLPSERAVAPNLEPRTSGGLVPGKLIHRVPPVYPQAAYMAHIAGEVVLNAVIRPDGTIGTVAVVSGNPMLARAAVDAVKQWRYEPYRLNGVAVEANANVRLTFQTHR